MFVVKKVLTCCDKTFVATKIILVAVPASDRQQQCHSAVLARPEP